MLRKKSFTFIQQELRQKLSQKESFSRQEKLFTGYGFLSLLWTVGMLLYFLSLIISPS